MNDTAPKMDRLTALLAERPWLLADGATGSNLFERGLQSGDAPELWNTEHPERVAHLQRAFVEAGADIILTNSFGGTRHRLKLHKAEASRRGAQRGGGAHRAYRGRSRRARGAGRRQHRPDGRDSRAAWALEPERCPRGLCRTGRGPRAAAARTFCGSRPCRPSRKPRRPSPARARRGCRCVATLSFDTNGRTMMGITPAELAGTAPQARPCGLRQQLRHRARGARGLHGQSRHGLGSHGRSRRQGELRHSAIRRRARSASTARRN